MSFKGGQIFMITNIYEYKYEFQGVVLVNDLYY